MIDYLRKHNKPLEPIPTDVSPKLPQLEGIRAVVFDIYGTLMISAAGDISLVQENASERSMRLSGVDTPGAAERYHKLVGEHQARLTCEYPEVEIREVWGELLGTKDSRRIEETAIRYECHANPAWPMPHCKEVIQWIRDQGMALGIVSNAQFYTRLLFPAFLEQDLEALGFDPEIMVFSYEEREGKPSRELYRKLATGLETRGIAPEETLYVGNDLKKDIWPANLEGFRTVLFAGDRRSLRLYEEDARLKDVEPDGVATDLVQLQSILTGIKR